MLSRYEDAFSDLNVGRSHGHEKPHKPIMLLAVMDLFESGRIRENRIEFEPELLERFKAYFDIVKSGDDSPTPLLPFFHLRGDKFWHHHPRPGQESAYQTLDNPGGKGRFLGVVDHAYLDDALFQLLRAPDTRDQLRQVIIRRYFSTLSTAITALRQQEQPISLYEDFLRKKVAGKVAENDAPDANKETRDAAFSRVVRAAYDFRCAACGLRVFLDDGTILVEAAHIIPFHVSKDNDPRNGMALCRNHHWAMDEYLVAPVPAQPGPVWRVSNDLDRRIEGQTDLLSLDGTTVLQPRDPRYHPREDTLCWRKEHLRTTS